MNIGILGSGDVAKTLGAGFIAHGHRVKLGTRSPEKLAEWQSEHGAHASVGSFADAAAFGEAILLATQGTAALSALELADHANFTGKLVMDATNALRSDDRGMHLAVGFDDSLGEQIQRALPNANVVKVFNTVGAGLMVNPALPGGPPDMCIAGNSDAAKQQVTAFLTDFGWNAVDLGGIEASRYLEPLAMVWILHALRSGSFNHAFKFLRT